MSGGTAEDCIYGDVPLLKEPFGDVDTIPVSLAPDAELTREGIHLYRELQLRDLQFEFSGSAGAGRKVVGYFEKSVKSSLFQSKDEPGEEAGRWWRKLLSGLDSEPI